IKLPNISASVPQLKAAIKELQAAGCAIRLDAAMAANRPGRHGVWQRPRERLLLRRCPLLIPQSAEALTEVPRPRPRAVVVPPPVELGPPPRAWAERDVAAVTYASDPAKKGLDRVLAAWRLERRDGEELVVCGAPRGAVAEAAGPAGVPAGVRDEGSLAPDAFAALLRRARAFVIAPRREDHGLVQLEALAAGCRVVTTAAPGAYVALSVVRAATPRLVVDRPDDAALLGGAIRSALDAPRGPGTDDAARSRALLAERFDAARVDATVRDELLPALLG
ncbi:NADP-dependent isocitrate dehydrogenase, partial [Patulibacter sp. NPDC049589]|uniref:NADP-dependent isocitrate dehydrogenase n=1 Tax=Patulibacter sp. NPDC049589 TaxID=3154731 RepID=UPI00343F4DB0